MLAVQASIGALNDLVDVDLDRDRKPGKPLPRRAATRRDGAGLVVVGLALGLGLSALSNPATALVAAAGAACGYAYDLRLSRTAWSWLPLALALPLVPLHAWLGATGSAPPALVALVPAGVLAGSGLALGNGIVDDDRDRAAGIRTAVGALGRGPAWLAHAACLAAAVGIALLAGPDLGLGEPWRGPATLAAAVAMASGAFMATRPSAAVRERGWELEAVGVAILGVAWLAGIPVR